MKHQNLTSLSVVPVQNFLSEGNSTFYSKKVGKKSPVKNPPITFWHERIIRNEKTGAQQFLSSNGNQDSSTDYEGD